MPWGPGGGPCPTPRLALFVREGFCSAHMNLEDFLTRWPRLFCCFSDPIVNACKHIRHASGLSTGEQGYTASMLKYLVLFNCPHVLWVWEAPGFMPVNVVSLLFTFQVVWLTKKKKKTLGNSPNKPHILFMIDSKSQLIALTGAVKPYLLIMLAFQWHPRFDRF